MCSKCSAVNYHTVLLAFALTVSPTASPKSSEKRASSRRPENGQRLADNVDNSSTKPVMEESPVVRSQSEASINGAFNYSQRDFLGESRVTYIEEVYAVCTRTSYPIRNRCSPCSKLARST